MIKITVKNRNNASEKSYSFKKHTIVMGRVEPCDVCLNSETVSRKHCQWHITQNEVFIEDLGSGNGTYVNQKLIPAGQKIALKTNDVIRIEEFIIEWATEKPLPEYKTDAPLDATDPDLIEMKMIKKVVGAFGKQNYPKLVLQSAPFENRELVIKDPDKIYTIGRDPSCDLSLDSAVLSRKHAQIASKWGTPVLSDCESKNGTFVNNVLLESEVSLKDQDQILLGTLKAVFIMPQKFNFSEIASSLEDHKFKNEDEKKPEVSEPSAQVSKTAAQTLEKVPLKEKPAATEAALTKSSEPKEPASNIQENPAPLTDEIQDSPAKPLLTGLKNFTTLEWALILFGVLVVLGVVFSLQLIF